MTNVLYASAYGAQPAPGESLQSTAYQNALSGRFNALNMLWTQNNAKSAFVADGSLSVKKDADTGFSDILIDSFSSRSGERAVRRAQDAAADLKRYGGETRDVSGKKDSQATDGYGKTNSAAQRSPEEAVKKSNYRRDDKTSSAERTRPEDINGRTGGAGAVDRPEQRYDNGDKKKRYTIVADKPDKNKTAGSDATVNDIAGDNAATATGFDEGNIDYAADAGQKNTNDAITQYLYADLNNATPYNEQADAFFDGNAGERNVLEDEAKRTAGNEETPADPANDFNDAKPGGDATLKTVRADLTEQRKFTSVDNAEFATVADFEETLSEYAGESVRVRVFDTGQKPEHTTGYTVPVDQPPASSLSGATVNNDFTMSLQSAATENGVQNVGPETFVELSSTAQVNLPGAYADAVSVNGAVAASEGDYPNGTEIIGTPDIMDAQDGGSRFNTGAFTQSGGAGQNGNASEGLNDGASFNVGVQNASFNQTNQTTPSGSGASAAQTPKNTLSGLMPGFLEDFSREAKILLEGGKNEFLMQLKPESLGKVAMRIITENGIVNARFIVENEQARAALEENLSGLGEALGELGMQVQNCSVEVRDGSDQTSGYPGLTDAGKRNRKHGSSDGEYGTSVVLDAGMRAFLRNRYYEQQSSVHFTA